jgi:hypothetical protein
MLLSGRIGVVEREVGPAAAEHGNAGRRGRTSTARQANAMAAWVVDMTFGWSTSNTVASAGQGHRLIGGQILPDLILFARRVVRRLRLA